MAVTGQQWKVEGETYSYTFPATFELRSYIGSVDHATSQQHGVDGESVSRGRHRRGTRTLEIFGMVQKTNPTQTLEELQAARAAIENLQEEFYLVNTVDNLRIPVRLLRVNVPREMASIARASFIFRSTTQPFWESRTLTEQRVTLQRWHDITNAGDMPVIPDLRVAGPVSNPATWIQGNWSWKLNMFNAQSTALNSKVAVSLWGKIDATLQRGPTRGGAGFATGQFISFDTMPDGADPALQTSYRPVEYQRQQTTRVNRWQFHMTVDVKPNITAASSATMYVFQSSNPTPISLFWGGAARQRWIFEDGFGNVASLADTFATPYEWINLQLSASAGASVIAGRQMMLALDGATPNWNVQPLSYTEGSPGTKMYIGSDRAKGNHFDGSIRDFAWYDRPIKALATIKNIASGMPYDCEQSPLIYFDLRAGGRQTSIGSERFRYMDVTGIASSGGHTLTLRGNANKVFNNGEWVCIEDRTGFGVWGVATAISPTTILLETRGGTAIASSIDVGAAVQFLATSQRYFRAPLTTTNDVSTGDLGVSFWFRTLATGRNYTIAAKRGASGAGWWIYTTAVGSLVFVVEDDAANVDTIISTQTVNGGDWHNAIFTLDKSDDYEWYIDGTERGEDATPSATGNLSNATAFCIGARSDATLFFEGEIRDFHFWGDGASVIFNNADTRRDTARIQCALPIQSYVWNVSPENAYYKMTQGNLNTLQDDVNDKVLVAQGPTPLRVQRALLSDDLVTDAFADYTSLGDWRITGGDPLSRVKANETGQTWRGPRYLQSTLTVDEEYSRTMRLEAGKSYYVDYQFQMQQNRLVVRDLTKSSQVLATTSNIGLTTNELHRKGFVFTIGATPVGVHECAMVMDSTLTGPGSNFTFYVYGLHVRECIVGSMNESTSGWSQVGSPSLFTTTATEHSGTNALRLLLDADGEGALHTLSLANSTPWIETTFNLEGASGGEEIDFRLTGFPTISTPVAVSRVASADYQQMRMINKLGVSTLGTLAILGSNGNDLRIDDLAVFERGRVDVSTNVPAQTPGAFPNLVPTRWGYGRDFHEGKMSFGSMIQRPDRVGVIQRLMMNTLSTAKSRILIEIGKGTSSLATHYYQFGLNASSQRWFFGNGVNTIGGPATSEAINKTIEVAAMIISDGSVKKAILYEGGTIINSLQTFTVSVPTLTHLQVGSDRDGNNPANLVIADGGGLHQYPGDSFFDGLANAQKPMTEDNQVMTWASAMPTTDTLLVFGTSFGIKRLSNSDETLPTLINQKSAHNALFLQYARGSAYSHSRFDTVYANQAMTITHVFRPRFN